MNNKKKVNVISNKNGITLIALVVTIVILIILATISVNIVLNGGLVNKADSGARLHKIEAAKEKLSMTLGGAALEKRMNTKYNENEFLDELILKEIPGAKILGDVVVVDGYGFEIDRSVPKIGKYVGEESELVFPELTVSAQIAEDSKSATIKITTKEEKNGISKIEIIEDGFVVQPYTYENKKEEIVENYTVSRNGRYIVKVYSALSRTELIEVNGLVANIKYSPNGSEEYKKEHTVQISVDTTVDKVKSIKYQWTNTTEEPEETSFTQSCTDGTKITKNEVTGSWYLWTFIETEAGKKRIERSEAFNFDNTAPQVELTSTPASEESFTLTATATDEHSKIAQYEFYVENKLVKTIKTNEESSSFEVTGKTMGEYDSYVIVVDSLGNAKRKDIQATTMQHTWHLYSYTTSIKYSLQQGEQETVYAGYNFVQHTIDWDKGVFVKGTNILDVKSMSTWDTRYVIGTYPSYYYWIPTDEITHKVAYIIGNWQSENQTVRRRRVEIVSNEVNVIGNWTGNVLKSSTKDIEDGEIKGDIWYKYMGIQ